MGAHLAHQGAGMALDLQRVQEIRRAGLGDIGDRRRRTAEGLAEPDQALIGVQLEPNHVAVRGHLNGLDRDDLHGSPCPAAVRPVVRQRSLRLGAKSTRRTCG